MFLKREKPLREDFGFQRLEIPAWVLCVRKDPLGTRSPDLANHWKLYAKGLYEVVSVPHMKWPIIQV